MQENILYYKFAKYYDIIYADKDYEKECDFIEAIIQAYHVSSNPRKILDIGCGSGEHAMILAQRGYQMTGIDFSETMISMAKKKSSSLNIDFQIMDMTEFSLAEKFDVCTCLFSSICYLPRNDDLKTTLKSIRESLQPDGLFIFDFWNGIAVISQKPSIKIKDVKYDDDSRIIRIAEPELDLTNQICSIKYHCLVIKGEKLTDEFEEIHPIRFFFPREIESYLQDSGFKIIKVCSLLNYSFEQDPDNWCLTIIAKKEN